LEEVKNLKQEIQALQDEKALREKLIEFIKEDEVFYQKQVALSLEIGKNAEICEQPPSLVKLVFQEGGSLQVTLNNWKYREKQKARNFSTEKNTIRNVTYKPNGGAFEFDVVVTEEKLKMEQEVLFFKIRRVRYNETDKTGKIFFNGEFIRKPNPDYCAALHMADLCVDRYGIVKFNSEDAKED
ncbi:MAG: hypothetical protein HY072_00955, partial [Deltaproteobacteria bacterium]|nr:hypothetical protein [Deltaproteobacteria bacterium]